MIEYVKKLIKNSDKIVFFGGAGTSTESDIPDFRSESGLFLAQNYYGHSPEKILSLSFFKSNPEIFYKYLKENLLYPDAKPHEGHKYLTNLEIQGKLIGIITQNIDGLHQKSGSKKVIEIHGNLNDYTCTMCGKYHNIVYVLNNGYFCSDCNGLIKPNVILYEEPLDNEIFRRSKELVREADLLIIGGTSLNVYPAAGLVRHFKKENIVIINKDKTKYDSLAKYIVREPFGQFLSKL
jgi:NAD-dependent deacetylase